MAKKKKKSPIWVVIALVVAGLVWYLQNSKKNGSEHSMITPPQVVDTSSKDVSSKPKNEQGKEVPKNNTPAAPARKSVTSSKADTMFSTVHFKQEGGFEKMENCRVIDHRWNDGDSFYVDNGFEKLHYRLYFVDTPESAYKEYRDGNNNGSRLDDQGDYFGGLSRDYTAKVGQLAKKYVMQKLTKKPFTILTKGEPVTNRSDEQRIHGFVIIEHEGEPTYLHELLVAKGLVRIKTRGTGLPGGRSFYKQRDHLRLMEKEAKKAKVGAWSIKK